MPKYLIQASYTTQGIQGLVGDSASGRRADVQEAVKAVGGKVEAFYYAFGPEDVIIILDLPDNITAAAVALNRRNWRGPGPNDTSADGRGGGQSAQVNMRYRAPGQ